MDVNKLSASRENKLNGRNKIKGKSKKRKKDIILKDLQCN
jgi:hypothetical protein